ncbi:hypothetical protein OG612_06485 [Streptomyces sp. NBC_01527]|uniref:hypothetical protein n=1 Tax=unclassified Streptomyces TaxID=2593676 RepID=UPI002E154A43|nr:hypothetical protein OG763_37005 [Streptomyces sp. NBC_01230]
MGRSEARGHLAPGAAGPVRGAALDRLLDLAVRDAGAVFLPAIDGRALRLEVTTEMPAELLAP